MPVYPVWYVLVPTRVRPCTKLGTPSYPHGYARIPSRVRPRTRMGLPVYQVGYALVPVRVRLCTRLGTPSYPHGYAHVPSRVRSRTRMGIRTNPPDFRAHLDDSTSKTAGFPGTSSLSLAQNRPFPGYLHLVPRPKPPVSRAPQACPARRSPRPKRRPAAAPKHSRASAHADVASRSRAKAREYFAWLPGARAWRSRLAQGPAGGHHSKASDLRPTRAALRPGREFSRTAERPEHFRASSSPAGPIWHLKMVNHHVHPVRRGRYSRCPARRRGPDPHKLPRTARTQADQEATPGCPARQRPNP